MKNEPIETADKPLLRDVEAFPASTPEGATIIILRDPSGFVKEEVALTQIGALIASHFDGRNDFEEIARLARSRTGMNIKAETVKELAQELDKSFMLENERFQNEKARQIKEFQESRSRKAHFAGEAYPAAPEEIRSLFDALMQNAAQKRETSQTKAEIPQGTPSAIIAPHIDIKRGGASYAAAFDFLKSRLPKGEILFVIFGVAHNGLNYPVSLLDKDYETPLGTAKTDSEAVKFVAEKLGEASLGESIAHRTEHSVEFQAIWLKHILGDREDWKILPALIDGIHLHLASGIAPESDERWNDAVEAFRALAASRKNVIFVLGVDFAHIGLRFGDPPFVEAELAKLEIQDKEFIQKTMAADEKAMIADIKADFMRRKYCGLGACYLLARIYGETKGAPLDYGADLDEGSVVSFAAAALFPR